jgi:ribosomal protein S18 acetylase RimI-like enzyme
MIDVSLINDVFRGPVYGRDDIFTPASFRRFVLQYDVDLSRAMTVSENGKLAGAVAFGMREKRAWFALIGVKPEFRRRGYGWQLFSRVVAAARASGAQSMEFEVMQHNHVAVAMYQKVGFAIVDELAIWARKPMTFAANDLRPRKHREAAIAALVQSPSACWQREPRSIALAPPSALIRTDGAYAYVRAGREFATVLDAGARDVTAARALVAELDRCVSQDLTLLNEPSRSPLSAALRESSWRIVKRQHRMILRAE